MDKKKPITRLYDSITALRAAASAIYDRGIALGLPQDEVAESVKPLTHSLHQTITGAVTTDIPAVVMAIVMLEHQAMAFEEDAKHIRTKAKDAMYHSAEIRASLIRGMKKRGVTKITDSGFTVTLVQDEKGQDVLTVR